MMKKRIGVTILLSLLLLSLLVVPSAVAAEGDKSLIKDMVQSPADYSVNHGPVSDFIRLYSTPYWRVLMWSFDRLPVPCWDWKYGVGC